jgi:UDP-glucose 4-epimerase
LSSVLVIGGAGFIGSNLCKRLVASGVDVYSLDNYSTGSELNHIEGVKYKKGDACNINQYSMPLSVDVVFHLGEYSRVEQSESEPFKAIHGICSTIPAVVEYCFNSKAKLIYSGSSTKFGDSKSVYSICKESNTVFVKNICDHLSVQFAITYFYNVYGPGEIREGQYSTVVAKFLRLKKNNKIAEVSWPGTQKRNFTHVDDIVDGLIIVANKGHGDEYGIGSSKSYSVIELCEMIGLNYKVGGKKSGNRMTSDLITEKTKQLGWTEKRSLKNYLNEKKGTN